MATAITKLATVTIVTFPVFPEIVPRLLNCNIYIYIHTQIYIYIYIQIHIYIYIIYAVVKRLATPSDFHIPLPSVGSANSPTPAVAASKLDLHQMMYVQFELLMMGGKTA
jgi:hypothetical protein